MVAALSAKAAEAATFSVSIANFVQGAFGVTLARNTVRIPVVPPGTLVTARSAIFWLAEASTGRVVADVWHCTFLVAGTEPARWVVIEADLAVQTLPSTVAVAALALPCFWVTGVAHRCTRIAETGLAIRKAVVSFGAAVTILAIVVFFARALSPLDLTDPASRSLGMAVARTALGEAVVSHIALVAVRLQELRSTFALAGTLGTVSGREGEVAAAWLAHIGSIQRLVVRPVKARLALVAVDAISIMPAVLTDASSVVDAVDVQTLLRLVHFFIVDALVRVSEAVARLADVGIVDAGAAPLVLLEPWTTLLTLRTTGVVLAPTVELVLPQRVVWIGDVAGVSVAIADTPSTDIDILDTVEIPASNCGVLAFDRHEMS